MVLVLERASKPIETWYETLGFCALVFSAFSCTTNQVALTTAFLKTATPGRFMRLWNLLNAPSFLASLTWQQHLRHTLPCVVTELGVIYLLTGLYLKVEIKRDPDHLFCAIEWLLWSLGREVAEL